MFSHLLVGELVFILLGPWLGFELSAEFLIVGAFWGILPDILSFFLNQRVNYQSKWFHKHRDNLSHTIFLPLIIFLLTLLLAGWKISLLISLAAATHPLLDLFGIGWGVKLFMPFSQKTYKLFFRNKFIYTFKDDEEIDRLVREIGSDDWFRRAYFSIHHRNLVWWWAIFEWGSLLLAILLPLSYFILARL